MKNFEKQLRSKEKKNDKNFNTTGFCEKGEKAGNGFKCGFKKYFVWRKLFGNCE